MMVVHRPGRSDVHTVAEKTLISRDIFGDRLAYVIAAPGRRVQRLTAEDAESAEENRTDNGDAYHAPHRRSPHPLIFPPWSAASSAVDSSRIRPNPAISRILALPALIQVRRLELAQGICRQPVAFRLDIHAVEPSRIETEDLRLIFLGQLGVAERRTQLIGDLEALERIDHPLGRTPPQTIRPPDHMVH